MLEDVVGEEIIAQAQNVTRPDMGEGAPKKTEKAENQKLSHAEVLDRWLEVISTILLAIVAVATAWSGYESARWSGVQADNYVVAGGTRVESRQGIYPGRPGEALRCAAVQ